MQRLVTERVKELRQEIGKITDANRLYALGGIEPGGAADGEQKRRATRLREIMEELDALTEWKKP
jgi:hypothetical protein